MTLDAPGARRDLDLIWRRALAAVDPYQPTLAALADLPSGRITVLGAGKAAARMAQAVEARFGDQCSGLVTVPPGHGAPLDRIRLAEGGHPVPMAAGAEAAAEALRIAGTLTPADRLVVLLSGGASALWTLPPEGVELADLQALNRRLLESGAVIHEINTVRKHVSRINGGRLAVASGTPSLTLIVSDVPGDDVSAIGSGPTAGDPTTLVDAQAALSRHGVDPGPRISAALADPRNESVKPRDPRLAGSAHRILLNAATAQDAAARAARELGYEPVRLGDHVEGEAREVARRHAVEARARIAAGRRCALISGGELSVSGAGVEPGGRCREYLLALAVELGSDAGACAVALDTDGIDGAGGDAGAVVTPDTLRRAAARGLDAAAMLDAHASGRFFRTLDDQIETGPTLTNVSDFRVILVG